MKRLTAAAILLLLATTVSALTAYRSLDGNLYVKTDSATTGPGWQKVTVAPVLSDTDPKDPEDPDDPEDPEDPEDKFGLIAVSKAAADAVPTYAKKEQHRLALAAGMKGISSTVRSGLITNEPFSETDPRTPLHIAFNQLLSLSLGDKAPTWKPWRDAVDAKFASVKLSSADDAADALMEVAIGLAPEVANNSTTEELRQGLLIAESNSEKESIQRAIDLDNFLKIFLEKILPIILMIIKLISGGI